MVTQSPSLDRRVFLRGTVMVAGGAIALPSLATLGGCASTPPTLTEHMELISAVSDRIIPATDTGGALAAKVPEYIAAVYEQHFTQEQQSEFASGLVALADTGLSATTTEEQDAILKSISEAPSSDAGSRTFQQIRDMTIFGYYTSETATQELAYEEIPGRYDACVPLAEIGRAWLDRGV